jgi:DNA polymerase I-like protein with 3'-5' exonuclease and polymerase domains
MISLPSFHPETSSAYRLFHEGILALAEASQAGMRLDVRYSEHQLRRAQKKRITSLDKFKKTKLARRWEKIQGGRANFTSDHQLSNLLFKHMKLTPVFYTESGAPSVNNATLRKLMRSGHPDLAQIIELKKNKKIIDYFENFLREQVDGYLHPDFKLHIARTFRSSCSNPNLQNVAKRDREMMEIIRRALLPHPGEVLTEVDFSGLEVSIACCYHQDPTMYKYLTDPASDMHRDMCMQIYKLGRDEWTKDTRFYAKNGFVFPQFYGDYYGNCAYAMYDAIDEFDLKTATGTPLYEHLNAHGISDYDDFEEHVKEIEEHFWATRFPVYNRWKKKQWARYCRDGYVDLFTGFRCAGVMNKKEVVNYPIQGSAFHCLLWAFVKTAQSIKSMKALRELARLIGQIHDSEIASVRPEVLQDYLGEVHEIATERLPRAWPWITVPLEVEADATGVDEPWSEKKEVTTAYENPTNENLVKELKDAKD